MIFAEEKIKALDPKPRTKVPSSQLKPTIIKVKESGKDGIGIHNRYALFLDPESEDGEDLVLPKKKSLEDSTKISREEIQ